MDKLRVLYPPRQRLLLPAPAPPAEVLLFKNRLLEKEITALRAELAYWKAIDQLTQLHNKEHFIECVSNEMLRSDRTRDKFSVVFIDVDNFKEINDTKGHLAGDQVLRNLGALIKSAVRKIDVPARYGGDEFALLLPGADGDAAMKFASRLLREISNLSHEIKVTVSIGIATHDPSNPDSAGDLIKRADDCMYKAKNAGRNQIALEGAPTN